MPPTIHHKNQNLPHRDRVLSVLSAALEAVAPDRLLRDALAYDGHTLRCGEHTYDLDQIDRLIVIGAGKASAPMARALEEMLGDRIDEGFVVVREGYTVPTDRIELHEAAHPVPDERSMAGAQRVLELASDAGPNDLVINLLSGGGSALLVAPAEGLELDDLQQMTDVLVASGADITAINAVRKHCSAIKGGRLAEAIAPARSLTLVLSDVVGNQLDAIASGPTVPDSTTFEDAWDIVDRFDLEEKLPEAVIAHLQAGKNGELAETPKDGDEAFDQTAIVIIGDCNTAAEAALEQAKEEGFHAQILTTTMEGEAREVAVLCAAIAREVREHHRPVAPPACLLLAGETTVTLRGEGTGGRNQELALAAAIAIDAFPRTDGVSPSESFPRTDGVSPSESFPRTDGVSPSESFPRTDGVSPSENSPTMPLTPRRCQSVIVAALATDGTDGPTDAAGAIVDGQTVSRGRKQALDAADHLTRNDAYPFLEATGELITTGPTNTNVNDLVCLFVTTPSPSDPTP